MNFSIHEKARMCGPHAALVLDGESISYASLSRRVFELTRGHVRAKSARSDVVVFDARLRLGELVQLYAFIEQETPFAPIHPRTTPRERERIRRALDARSPSAQLPFAVIATSGTSGEPKGVELSKGAWLAAARASSERLPWQEEDRWLLSLSYAHVGGLGVILRCLYAGKTVVVDSHSEKGFDSKRFVEVVERDGVTIASLVPTQLTRLLKESARVPSTLRAVLVGGANLPPSVSDAALERGWPILPTYGLTETCGQVATACPGQSSRDDFIGPALDDVGLEIREGRIAIRSPTLFTRYVADPFVKKGEWFLTGDCGEIDHRGFLRVLGRADDIINSGGCKIAPAEVENALMRVKGVEAAVAFGEPDPEWGKRVVAAVVLQPDSGLERWSTEHWRDSLRSNLTDFKLPRRVVVVKMLKQLPNGKWDRRALEVALGSVP